MLDIKRIKDDPAAVKAGLRAKEVDCDAEVDRILELDVARRELIAATETMKAEQNKVSKEIPLKKKAGEDVAPIFARMGELKAQIAENDEKLRDVEAEYRTLMLSLPNLPDPDLKPGGKENNEPLRYFGEPHKFDFEPKAHWDLGTDLDILDFEKAAAVTGARFTFYKGLGSRLERSIYNFMLDTHTANGKYEEVFPPYIVHKRSLYGTGQFPKFMDQEFHLEGTDYYLIPTAEVPVTNMYRESILDGAKLPIYHCAYSACFRREAGSAGRDTRGLIRQHQFNKVELVKFVRPETSYDELEKLTNDAEKILQLLKLPYRVVALSAGDLGFSAAKTYDIEVWMPSDGRYVEISSCSNFEDFQARRANIRYRDGAKGKTDFIHTLNGSGLAVGRTVAAIMENYQQADGSIVIPDALRDYMRVDRIEK